MTNRDALRAAFAAAATRPAPTGRGRPTVDRGEDLLFAIALDTHTRALQIGGRGALAEAMREVALARPPFDTSPASIDWIKKAIKRRPLARKLAVYEHTQVIQAAEIRRRLRNIPADRLHVIERMPAAALLELLRNHRIDGDFPSELLDEIATI